VKQYNLELAKWKICSVALKASAALVEMTAFHWIYNLSCLPADFQETGISSSPYSQCRAWDCYLTFTFTIWGGVLLPNTEISSGPATFSLFLLPLFIPELELAVDM